jgi:hypothetical protein
MNESGNNRTLIFKEYNVMKTRTSVKAGGIKTINHNERVRVRSRISAGKLAANHNQKPCRR